MPRACPFPLSTLAAANAELMDAPIAQNVPSTSNHRRVRQVIAEILISEIGMCVEVDHRKLRMFLCCCLDRGQAHKMFAANQEGQTPALQNVFRIRMNHIKSTFRISERKLQITTVKGACVLEIEILIRTVRFQSVGLRAHGTGGEPRSWAIGCR